MADQWYYTQRGQRQGPVPVEELKQLASSTQLKPTDLVWKEGMAAWGPASSVEGLFSSPTEDEPPPIPPEDEPPRISPSLTPQSRHSSSILPLALAVLIVAALIGSGAFVYMRGGNKQVAKSDADKDNAAQSQGEETPAAAAQDGREPSEKVVDSSKKVQPSQVKPKVSVVQSVSTPTGWITLFDGKTLDGWHLRKPDGPNCWSVENGELTCTAQGRRLDLISDAIFQDFELQLDFLMGDGANSGVFLRGVYEVQLYDHKPQTPPKSRCGAIIGQVAPSENAYLGPGKWNTLNVKLVGQVVTVTMNGTRIIDHAYISGPTDKEDTLPIQDFNPGPIMLQCWDKEVRFRNISIKRIEEQAQKQPEPVTEKVAQTTQQPLAETPTQPAAKWRMTGEYPLIAGKWSEWAEKGRFVTIQQDDNKFVAHCTYNDDNGVEVHWRADGTISKDGEITARLVHTKPEGYKAQTRTGTLDQDGNTIHGHAKWERGEYDFTWRLKEPYSAFQ